MQIKRFFLNNDDIKKKMRLKCISIRVVVKYFHRRNYATLKNMCVI